MTHSDTTRELLRKRLEPGGCDCDDLRSDGTCKSCGCMNIKIPISSTAELLKIIHRSIKLLQLDQDGDVIQ